MYRELIKKLLIEHDLSINEYIELLGYSQSDVAHEYIRDTAADITTSVFGNKIYIRGLIEISSYCKNNCYYCGIRRENRHAERYRLTLDEILSCCEEGYSLGFRTFVIQGGEDSVISDASICDLIRKIKKMYPNCAVTLSIGEKSRDTYQKFYDCGADRYLLRHETADSTHYSKLHPKEMSLDNRIRCLEDLKDIGFQTGCGFMVGSPYQTVETIAEDLKFISSFKPHMAGIGPFIPHKDTPFAGMQSGDLKLTLFLLAIIRIISPQILLPATTALGTLNVKGREMGILYGANVVMPNLSPIEVRKKYMLYNNKISTGIESAQGLELLRDSLEKIGFTIVYERGDSTLY